MWDYGIVFLRLGISLMSLVALGGSRYVQGCGCVTQDVGHGGDGKG